MAEDQLQEEQLAPEIDENGIDAGTVLMAWDTWEFPPVERSRSWYLIAGTAALGMIIYGLLTANYGFAIIIIMFAVLVIMKDVRKPAQVTAAITTHGIVFNHEFFTYDSIKDFAIVYNPPEVKNLYITFTNRLSPMLSIPLEEANPIRLRQTLLPYLFENIDRDDESLTDTLTRVYKL
jgi:hypothetical protein